jgi:2-C-methyl-D-erythritol 4-phosphate cytidylyltransferase
MIRTAVIVAGGMGTRMGTARPKQFLAMAGKPILVHTLERLLHFQHDLRLVLVLPEQEQPAWHEIAARHFSADDRYRMVLAPGGSLRTHSVANGLQALAAQIAQPEQCLVAIHDGVRPFLTQAMLHEAYQTAGQSGASVACVKVKASLREVDAAGHSRAVDRSRFLEVQTPQTFLLDRILTAYAQRPHDRFTDDASLYEAVFAGSPVTVCEGSYDNIKITTPEDMFVAEQIWARFLP